MTIMSVSRQKLPGLLCFCDEGIIFRWDSPTAIVSSPIKFAEYLACGLPVVASANAGDLEEIIKSNRFGVILEAYNEAT